MTVIPCPSGVDHKGGVCTCRPKRVTGDVAKVKKLPNVRTEIKKDKKK
jgi:hypothetical protein